MIDAGGRVAAGNVAAMAAQAWFSRSDIEVVPGTSAVFQLTIVNLGDTTESFSLAPFAGTWKTGSCCTPTRPWSSIENVFVIPSEARNLSFAVFRPADKKEGFLASLGMTYAGMGV